MDSSFTKSAYNIIKEIADGIKIKTLCSEQIEGYKELIYLFLLDIDKNDFTKDELDYIYYILQEY